MGDVLAIENLVPCRDKPISSVQQNSLFLWCDYRKSSVPERITAERPKQLKKETGDLNQTLKKLFQSYKYIQKEKEENGIKSLKNCEIL